MKNALYGMAGCLKHAWLAALNRVTAHARLDALRRDVARLLRIEPVFVASSRWEYVEAAAQANTRMQAIAQSCAEAVSLHPSGTFHLRRFCLCCNETRPLLVDGQYGWVDVNGSRVLNWRERLVCPGCAMNNRQRLVAKLVQQAVARLERPNVYLMEQVTPIVEWLKNLQTMGLHGSEYLGHEYAGGTQLNGIRHEDVMNLSFPDESFDLIVSNDVLEHIPDPVRAFQECFRVLRPGGMVLATFPFHADSDSTRVRARMVGNAIEHLLPPQFHGNPVSSDGSLVFQDFGWDLLETVRAAGFSHAQCEVYASDEFGHLGPGLLVFRLRKPHS